MIREATREVFHDSVDISRVFLASMILFAVLIIDVLHDYWKRR